MNVVNCDWGVGILRKKVTIMYKILKIIKIR